MTAHLDAVSKTSPANFPLIKFLLMVLAMKTKEEDNAEILRMKFYGGNEQFPSAMLAEGLDPGATNYPLKVLKGTLTVAGGSGAIASAIMLAAQAGIKYWFEDITLSLSTDTASGGIITEFKDDSGGTVVCSIGTSINQPTVVAVPIYKLAGTANKPIYAQGDAGKYAALDNDDTVDFILRYREV